MTKARELAELSRTIIDTSDATAITINADEEVTLADDLFLADDKQLVLGNSSDFTLKHHNSGYGHVQNTGTLYIDSETIDLRTDNSSISSALSLAANNAATFSGSVTAASLTVTGALIANDVLTVIDGSTSAPSISNAGDSNTGIYFPADDQLGLLVGGSRKIHITSSGVDIENGSLTAGASTFTSLFAAKTASGIGNTGLEVFSTGQTYITRAGGPLALNNTSGVGGEIYLYAGGTYTSNISTVAGGISFGTGAGGSVTDDRVVIDSTGAVIVNNSGGDAQIYLGGTSGSDRMYLARAGNDSLLWNVDSGVMRFGTNNAEVMRLKGTNVGIGHTNPEYGLSIHKEGDHLQLTTNASGEAAGNGTDLKVDASSSDFQLLNYESANITLWTAGAQRLTIDSSGRVGVGGAPNSNWRNDLSSQCVLMLGTDATLFSDSGVTTELWNNAFIDNSDTFKNIAARGATRYMQFQGAHKWFTAASASAGSTISTEINSTPKMVLDVSGNLGIGTSSPNSYGGYTALTINGTSGGLLDFETNGTFVGEVYADGTNGLGLQSVGARHIKFGINGSEAMRITTSRALLVGTQNTGANHASDGAYITAGGQLIGRATGIVSYLNRRGSDGQILQFMQDGTNVGSMSTNAGALVVKGASTSAPVQLQTHDGNEDIEVDPDGFIKFETAGSERLRIDADGLKFHGDTAAANGLNDYEEGVMENSASNRLLVGGTSGYYELPGTGNSYNYTKIGRIVHVSGYLTISGSVNPVGIVKLLLPFTVASMGDDREYQFASLMLQNHGASGSGLPTQRHLFIQSGNYAYFYRTNDTGGPAYIYAANIDDTWQMGFSFTYNTID